MVLYALENVDDAFEVTREFLTDIDRTTWLKLAFVVFFIGGGGAGTNFNVPTGGNGDMGTPPVDDVPTFEPDPGLLILIAGIVLAILVIALLFGFVGAVMEFVFVESLRSEAVSVREYWGRYWRKGLRLFVFRIVLGLFILGPVLLGVALFLLPFGLDVGPGGVSILLLLALIPVFLVLVLLVGLVGGFTTVFVVPIMILEDCGVLDGWRRLWPTITAQWKQYLAYAVAGFVLSIAGGIFVFLVTAILVIVLLIPFGILFAIGFGLLSVAELAGIAWMVVVSLLFVLAIFVITALAKVPVQTYLRYYALLVLGDVDAELDLVSTQRAAVRESDEEV